MPASAADITFASSGAITAASANAPAPSADAMVSAVISANTFLVLNIKISSCFIVRYMWNVMKSESCVSPNMSVSWKQYR